MNLSFKPQIIPIEEKPIQLILASQSVGRKTLLEKLSLPFRTIISNVDEDTITDKDPYKTIKKRALAKSEEILKNPRLYNIPDTERLLIISADSMAVLGNQTFGKSADKEETKVMLRKLMGKTHSFVTATVITYLIGPTVKKTWEHLVKTKVTMKKLTVPELDLYATRYDFSRFAAGYSINEAPWDLITKIEGSYTNVIGLPFETILPIMRKLEIIK
jgi:septum formation protein